MGENPTETARAISKLLPSGRIAALDRGPQALGFLPAFDDIQRAVFEELADSGVKDIYIFDMMDEWKYLEPALGFAAERAVKDPSIKIIPCSCYTRPTDDGQMANTPEEMAELLVKSVALLKEKGLPASQIGARIKDYAGNLWSEAEAKEWMGENWQNVCAASVVKTVRSALDAAGYSDVPLHLHSHGQKPEALAEAIEAGANVVDVGIGVQSGKYTDQGQVVENTLAHTNIRDILAIQMAKRGFDISSAECANHPILERLSEHEEAVAHATEPVMDERRHQLSILAKVNPKTLRYHPMAGGAISALWGLIEKQWKKSSTEKMVSALATTESRQKIIDMGMWPSGVAHDAKIDQEVHFRIALRMTNHFWQVGGAFGTVTPGAKIDCEQSADSAMKMLCGKPVIFIPGFINVMIGRMGTNKGLDKGIGDTGLRSDLAETHGGIGLRAPMEGSGYERARAALDNMTEELGLEFGKNGMPTREKAELIVALTTDALGHEAAPALFRFLQTGQRTGKIEPSRTPYDVARTADEMVTVATLLDEGKTTELQEYIASLQDRIPAPEVPSSTNGRNGTKITREKPAKTPPPHISDEEIGIRTRALITNHVKEKTKGWRSLRKEDRRKNSGSPGEPHSR